MPIYIKFEGVKGAVEAAGAGGGIWKTTNFLTADPVGPSASGSLGVGFLRSMDGGRTWSLPLSRISLVSGVGGVDGRDVAPTRKAAELFEAAGRAPMGRLYIATDTGVYSGIDPQGRLLAGSDQGVWRSAASNRARATNNLKQIGLGCHSYPAAEILVCDAGGANARVYRLRNVTISRNSVQRSRVTSLTVTFDNPVIN